MWYEEGRWGIRGEVWHEEGRWGMRGRRVV